MAIKIEKIEEYLNKMDLGFEKRKENLIVVIISGEIDKLFIVIHLDEDGKYIEISAIRHLDELIAEANEDRRIELLKWMLNENYKKKIGTWEYNSEDHNHRITVGHVIEDGGLTGKQFKRMLNSVARSLHDIQNMKDILNPNALSEKEKKRISLLAQLQELDEEDGI